MERSVSGTAVLDKAVAILDALAREPLGISDLARITGVSRPTAHRLCAALEHHDLVQREDDDRRRLGSHAARWANAAPALDVRLIQLAQPLLAQLRDQTDESVQLYVVDGTQRRCVAAVESTQGLRTIVQVGELLPLNVGSAGKALQASSAKWVQSVEERQKGVASVSAGVFQNALAIGAVSISGPIERLTRSPGRKYGKVVQAAAEQLSTALEQR